MAEFADFSFFERVNQPGGPGAVQLPSSRPKLGTRGANFVLEWEGPKVERAVMKAAKVGLIKASKFLRRHMRDSLKIQGGRGRRSRPGRPPRRDTGALMGSINRRIMNRGLTARIGTDRPEGKWLELGTPPHTIVPRGAKAMSFLNESGQWIVTRRVNHPGHRPRPWLRPALDVFKSPRVLKLFWGKLI